MKYVRVEVLDSHNAPSCANELEKINSTSILWPWSAPNLLAKTRCPPEYMGFAQRKCIRGSDGRISWGQSDFSHCYPLQL